MAQAIKNLQECGTLNRVFAAFFINECEVKNEISFKDSKPQMPQIASLNDTGNYFAEGDSIHGLKHFFHGRVVIENIDLEHFRSVGIYDFFDDSMKDKIIDVARFFSNAVKSHQYCDFVFSSLPDNSPLIYDCIFDPDTNFRSRLIIGANFGSYNYTAVWEFYGLLMERFREIEVHPIYGQAFKSVDRMTDEEREKFNKPKEINDGKDGV